MSISPPASAASLLPPEETQRELPVLSGARMLLECLVTEEVDTIFGYPGGVILPIYDALVDYPSLRHILVRHEQGATHMAEGYARASGKPGVVLVTSGPGATNIVTGVADAYYDSVPLVVLTGNVPSHLMGNDAFQEADILGITRACTKHNTIVRNVADLPAALKEAFHIATTGRPGPVVVDLPKDVLLATAPFEYPATVDLPGYDLGEHYTQSQLDQVLRILETAERPIILAGGGAISANANDLILQLAERLQIPTANTLMGLGSFPMDHPLSLGFSGMHGHYFTNIAIANADALLVIGSRLNDRQTGKTDRFASNAKIIHIDLDPTSLQKNVEAFVPIQGNIPEIVQGLLSKLDASPSDRFADILKTRAQWMDEIESWKTRRERPKFPDGFLSPQFVIERLFHWLPKEGPKQGMVTTEVGQHQMWAAQNFSLHAPRSFITSGGLGTMGFGFPAALGIQVAYPERTIVDIAGDGSFQMTLQELATAMDYNLPVKVAIINNAHLGMIRQWQGKQYGRLSEATMSSPDYIKLAEAYGGKGFVITHPDQVDSVIREAYAITDRPVIMDFRVHERTDVYPWVPAGGANDEMLIEEKSAPPLKIVSKPVIREFVEPNDKPAFAALTREWVERAFDVLEQEDLDFIADPVDRIIAPGGQIFMADIDGKTVGTCGLQKMDDHTYELIRMAVTEGMQGLGIGKALLTHAIDWCKARKLPHLILETNTSRQPAIGMYTKFGFQHYTPLPEHCSPLERANVWMKLDLSPTEEKIV